MSIVIDGQGLNITVASYLDRLDFGFIVDRDLVPDVWELADLHIAEIGSTVRRHRRRMGPTTAAGRSATRPN